MQKVKQITYKGQEILFQSFKDEKDPAIITDRLHKVKEHILIQPDKSILLLSDVTNTYYNPELISIMKNFSRAITPHVKASAMVGITGITKIFFNALVKLTGREIKAINSLEEARDWLVLHSN